MIPTYIQTLAAIIQAAAAGVFLISVRRDANLRQHARREALVEKLVVRWNLNANSPSPAERIGFPLRLKLSTRFSRRRASLGGYRFNRRGGGDRGGVVETILWRAQKRDLLRQLKEAKA
jgi:hypothetical protein